jgi:hypothetical protein
MGSFNFNPILSEIQSHMAAMSPGAQAAVKMANPSLPSPEANAAATAPSVLPPGMLLPHPDAGPPPGNIVMPESAPALMPAQQPNVTAPRGTIEGDTNARGALLGKKPGWENLYSDVTNSRLGQAYPLAGKLLGGAAEVGGFLGNTLANAAPGIGREIPGTTLNHNMLLGQANTALTQDVGNAQKEAQTASENATAQKTEAETPEVVPEAEARIGQENATAGHENAETANLQNPPAKFEETPAGPMMIHPDGTAQHVTVDGKPIGAPIKLTYQTVDAADGPHVYGVNEQGQKVVDLGKHYERPAVNVNAGEKNLWSVPQPDGSKKVVELHPGDKIPSGAVSLAGQSQQNSKEGSADAPTISALKFANDYLKGGQYTGPSDEALQDQFFQMAKPSTGFRMNQAQIDQLHRMQSWVNSAKGAAYHAQTGTWFSPEQRKEIVQTMNDLGKSKGIQVPGDNSSGPTPGTVENGYRFKGGDPGKQENWVKQ